MDTLVPSVLIRSSSNLQTTWTGIKSWTSSILDQSGIFASELHALQHENVSHRLIIDKTWTRFNDSVFDRFIIKLTGDQA